MIKILDKIIILGTYGAILFVGAFMFFYLIALLTTDSFGIAARLLMSPIILFAAPCMAVYSSLTFLVLLFRLEENSKEVERDKDKPILQLFLWGGGTLLVIWASWSLYVKDGDEGDTLRIGHALNQSALVTRTATIIDHRASAGNAFSSLVVIYHDIELTNKERLEGVDFFVPRPYLERGKTYELLMTPELDTIVRAQEIE